MLKKYVVLFSVGRGGRYEGTGKIRPYLFTVGLNYFINYARFKRVIFNSTGIIKVEEIVVEI